MFFLIIFYIGCTNKFSAQYSTNAVKIKSGDGFFVKSLKNLITEKQDVKKEVNLVVTRKQGLLSLVEKDPETFLRTALPKKIKEKFSPEIQKNIEEEVKLEGELHILHKDDFKNRISKNFYYLNTKEGKKYQLYFIGEGPSLFSGTKVKVHGIKIENKIAIPSLKEVDFKIISPDIAKVVENKEFTGYFIKKVPNFKKIKDASLMKSPPIIKKVAIILFNFQNDQSQPFTKDSVRETVFTDQDSVNSYFKEVSFGKLDLKGKIRNDGDIFGWYTIPFDNSGDLCSFETWSSSVDLMVQEEGINLGDYDNVIYTFPPTIACAAGYADFGGSRVWINGFTMSTISHELGHNFGLGHANAYNCLSGDQRVSIGNSCNSLEYGDRYDVMGSNDISLNIKNSHLNNYHKNQLGFFGLSNIKTITKSGKYFIYPIEKPLIYAQVLRIPRDIDSNGNVYSYYYLEYRQPYGFDSFASTSKVAKGVSIRLTPASQTNPMKNSNLIDATPQTDDFFIDAPLPVNNLFTDNFKGISIKPLSMSPQNAYIDINLFQPPCVHTSPTVEISPINQWGFAGDMHTYNIFIKNNDNGGCPASGFSITHLLPSGWQGTFTSTNPYEDPSTLLNNVLPGQSIEGKINILSTSDSSPYFHTFTETVTNQQVPQYSASVSANFNIIPTNTDELLKSVQIPIQ